jgi:Uma2 family endonuclease
MPTEAHQFILAFMFKVLTAFVESRSLGWILPAGLPVRLWEGKMREPDLVFLLAEHRDRRRSQYWEGADLEMEIVSDEGRRRDLVTKREEYARAGIAEYWIVDPQVEEILVLTLESSAYREHGQFGAGTEATSVLLPGIAVPVGEVFAAARQ